MRDNAITPARTLDTFRPTTCMPLCAAAMFYHSISLSRIKVAHFYQAPPATPNAVTTVAMNADMPS